MENTTKYELNFIGKTDKYMYLIEIAQIDDEDMKHHPLQYGVSNINEAKFFEEWFNSKNPQTIHNLIDLINEYENQRVFEKTKDLVEKLSMPNIIETSNNLAKGIENNIFNLDTINTIEDALKMFEKLSELVKVKEISKQIDNFCDIKN